jgi:hypothetical protein
VQCHHPCTIPSHHHPTTPTPTDNPHYDTLEGCYPWARDSLALHASDPRTHLYSMQQLEGAQTHDDLWNAAQLQMTTEGKMHVSVVGVVGVGVVGVGVGGG